MSLCCGIVGLPNVGKSTLFNALTQAGIQAANYPFCTIEPNIGVVPVADKRLDALARIVKPQKTIPTTIEFVDIAGLVKGASKGEGLGNQFLANIRETDVIIHVVRCFDHPDIMHVSGKIDPQADIDIINLELVIADLETVEKNLSKYQKHAKTGDKANMDMQKLLEKAQAHLRQGKAMRYLLLSAEEKNLLKPLHLLTLKQILYVANVNENGFENNPYLSAVQAIADKEHAKIIAICANIEADIAVLPESERKEFLEALNWQQSGLERLILVAYDLLGLYTYFTAGEKEVRAWTIHQGDTAPKAAAVIHTDFEKGFIRAEVIAYEDFIRCHGEQGAKEAGKWRLEGKDYRVNDGDIMHFRFNI